MLPYLRVHGMRLSDTYYYIHLVPGLMEEMSGFAFSSAEALLPEVESMNDFLTQFGAFCWIIFPSSAVSAKIRSVPISRPEPFVSYMRNREECRNRRIDPFPH